MVKFQPLALSTLTALFIAAAPSVVFAADAAIEIGTGRAALVTLGHSARSVVVGDPTIADVSVEAPNKVVVFGKRAGGTSLVVLGNGGSVLVNTLVVVHPGGAEAVTVTYANGKQVEPGGRSVVYACATTCARTADDRKQAAASPAKAPESE